MKVIIAGSRDISPQEFILAMNKFFDFAPTEIVSGGARGVDTYARKVAEKLGVKFTEFPADWYDVNGEFNETAGHIRNARMADYADALFDIWNGKSTGSKNMIDAAYKRNLIVRVVIVKDGKVELQ